MKKKIVFGAVALALVTPMMSACSNADTNGEGASILSMQSPEEQKKAQQEKEAAQREASIKKIRSDSRVHATYLHDPEGTGDPLLLVAHPGFEDQEYSTLNVIDYYKFDPSQGEYVKIDGLQSDMGSPAAGQGHGRMFLDVNGDLYHSKMQGMGYYSTYKLTNHDGEYKFDEVETGRIGVNIPQSESKIQESPDEINWDYKLCTAEFVTPEALEKAKQTRDVVVKGTFHTYSVQELEDKFGIPNANHDTTSRVNVVVFDKPITLQTPYVDGAEQFKLLPINTGLSRWPYSKINVRAYQDKEVYLAFDLNDLFWPTDTCPPIGHPHVEHFDFLE